MEPIASRLRRFSGTFYAYVPPELVERLELDEGDPIGLALYKMKIEGLKAQEESNDQQDS